MKSEKAIQNEILMAITRLEGAMFWREQSAKAWVGKVVEHRNGIVKLKNAMPIIAGVEGIGDIMGAYRRVPVAFEVKDERGQQLPSQKNFERAFTKAGGQYQVVRSVDEALHFLRQTIGG